MNYRGALSGNFNDYRSGWMKSRNSASINSDTFTKEYDLTFSLGRPTNRREVGNLLCQSGAFSSYREVTERLTLITINNNSTENGQVLIQCRKKEYTNEIVDSLISMADSPVKRCHSYNIQEIPVKFHFIHPSVSIQRDVVDKFLKKFGKVKSWHAQIDPLFKLLTGQYVFVLYEDDLKKNPLPSTVYINGVPTTVSYRGRVKTCFLCGEEGHYKSECPSKKDAPTQRCWECGEEGHIRINCPSIGVTDGKEEKLPPLEEDPPLPSTGDQPPPFLDEKRPEDRFKINNAQTRENKSSVTGVNDPAAISATKSDSNNVGIIKPAVVETEPVDKSDGVVDKTDGGEVGDEKKSDGEGKAPLPDDGGSSGLEQSDGDAKVSEPVFDSSNENDIGSNDEEMDVDERKLARKRLLNQSLDDRANKHSKWNNEAKNSRVKLIPNIKPGTKVIKVANLPSNITSTQDVKDLANHNLLTWADANTILNSTNLISRSAEDVANHDNNTEHNLPDPSGSGGK